MENNQREGQKERKKGFSGLQVFGIVIGVVIITVVVTLLAIRAFFFPSPFEPVVLTPAEQQQLEAKLDRLDIQPPAEDRRLPAARPAEPPGDYTADGRLRPQPYSEEGASREIHFTEREVNAIIATNTDLADKVAIDLGDDLVSARILVPMDPDFPMLGGKILRVRAGVEIAYREGRPVVKLKGVSLMGVPLPNAWLGGMKNIDLVKEFGAGESGWKSFADGVEGIRVVDGTIQIRLRE
ncbi:MAG: arginine N-succinyltransferase [Desulfobulbaceae bacterium]|nr:arginine N-succinyltransferase [Desulfobulbaceae bacterium]